MDETNDSPRQLMRIIRTEIADEEIKLDAMIRWPLKGQNLLQKAGRLRRLKTDLATVKTLAEQVGA
jgi:hypothetical protein